MRRIINPRQTRLFDPFDVVLTEKTRRRLLHGSSGVFHHVIPQTAAESDGPSTQAVLDDLKAFENQMIH